MNERIKQLQFQAAAQISPLLVGAEWQREFTEKFAELIVGECIRKIENEASAYAEPVWALELVNDIKEHFGVEE